VLKEPGFVRPYSVIPDLIRNPCSSERDDGRISGRGRNVSGYLQPIKIDPGSSPGVTEEEGNMDPGFVIPDLILDRGDGLLKEPGFVRPHSVIPDLIRNPYSSERDNGRPSGRG
jgi:hypothetical protein